MSTSAGTVAIALGEGRQALPIRTPAGSALFAEMENPFYRPDADGRPIRSGLPASEGGARVAFVALASKFGVPRWDDALPVFTDEAPHPADAPRTCFAYESSVWSRISWLHTPMGCVGPVSANGAFVGFFLGLF